MSKKKLAGMWYLYMIENRLGQLYTGITTDPKRRFEEHSQSGAKAAKALKGKGPLRQRLCVNAGNRSQASKLELAVKKLNKNHKLKLIELGQQGITADFELKLF
ncbi:GIY-YIG nuclease family protein [Neptunicella marina]|uniref:GIY-YIG nuclease family protein n=1 Tax=Neptunicella marina TaxID=2125989 RepID=A0A8J6IY15_9ALTE|nr:GIY-YIG nuclease family protein [Neptunicella marina]MBC3767411.1 GIY-YIG nuclease family protein [Neptunicella marina]